jgi:predicted PurR-regulated permease PerM
VALTFMTLVLIPAIGGLADEIGQQGSIWLTTLDGWTSRTFGMHIASASAAQGAVVTTQQFLIDWSGKLTGLAGNALTSGVSLVISVATIATFTFYFAADFPRLQRGLLSWFQPAHQQRLGWAIDESIDQVGTYLYSRLLLTAINAIGFFITMIAVGVPARLAMPLAIFGGFVSEFIPNIGTYIGGAIPTIFTFAIQDLAAAIVVLAYVVIYQQLENYWLSPKISAKTMELNGGLAFGAALAGGALFGPMGAFMALPVAALICSFIRNYRHGYTVSYESRYASTSTASDSERQEASEEAQVPRPTEGRP